MLIKDVMTKNTITIMPEESVKYAATLMKNNDIGTLIVMRDDKAVGIVTDRDIITRAAVRDENLRDINISDIMTSNPVICHEAMEVSEAMRIMRERQIRRVIVKDDNGITGIVTLGDISREKEYNDTMGYTLAYICTDN